MSKKLLPGLLLCVLIAGAGLLVAETWFVKDVLRLGPLLLVILLAMVVGSLSPPGETLLPGVRLSQKGILRLAVAGLGLRLSFQQLGEIGFASVGVIAVSTIGSLAFGYWIAKRMGLATKMAALLSVGTSICGASAIVAADSVLESEEGEPAVCLGTITLLGTIGIFAYPLIAAAAGMGDFFYGVWTGATLHEMAQVVAAGIEVSASAGETATVAKLARILLLAPVVVFLAVQVGKQKKVTGKVSPVPWFLVGFVALSALNSSGWVATEVRDWAVKLDLWLLCVGMAGVGLSVSLRQIRQNGLRPLLVGLIQWLFLAALAYVLSLLWLPG